MAKVFEDYFSEALKDMVSICVEYADYRAEKVFVYTVNEGGRMTCDFFFQFNGRIVSNTRINDVLRPGEKPVDTSQNVHSQVTFAILEDLENIRDACKRFNREAPTELFITYDATTRRFNTKVSYEGFYQNHPDAGPFDRIVEWMKKEAAKTGKEMVVLKGYLM